MSKLIYVKARKPGEKAWWFLTGSGGMNRLRVHAAPYKPEKIEEALRILRQDNPEFEFKQTT